MGTFKTTDRRRVRNRKIDRSVAKYGMKIMGIQKPVRSGYFRKHWREYADAAT